MLDIPMIVSLMLQQSRSYNGILEVYGFILVLAQGFRIGSRSFAIF